jgi:hypothetical protein
MKLFTLSERIQKLSLNGVLLNVLKDRKFEELLISMNRSQLFKGENKEGKTLKSIGGDYSPITKEIKSKKGLPTDRVTLFDTGKMYKSAKVKLMGKTVEMTLDSKKGSYELESRWGDKIAGLNEENKRKAEDYILNEVLQRLIEVF